MENNYPLIIFGAGASLDSFDTFSRFENIKSINLLKWVPPLTNNIFDRTKFEHILERYPEANQLAVEDFRVSNEFSLEDLITNTLIIRAVKNPIWYKRLISFRFYLQHLFSGVSRNFFHLTNNYGRLISLINEHSKERACFVNFNYDLLFERHLNHIAYTSNIDNYVQGSFKVIKIHGACNWIRSVGFGDTNDADFKNGKEFSLDNAEDILLSEISDTTQLNLPEIMTDSPDWDYFDPINDGFPAHQDRVKYYVPDLALPMQGKRNYVCPKKHIDILEKEMELIDRVIIIGWKAGDDFLINLMKTKLRPNTPIIVVSPSAAGEIASKLRNNGLSANSIKCTFTDFIKNKYCQEILSTSDMNVTMRKINSAAKI